MVFDAATRGAGSEDTMTVIPAGEAGGAVRLAGP